MSGISEKFTELLLGCRKASKDTLGLREKLLFLLRFRMLTPPEIMETLIITKSNLAHLTASMITSGLIEKRIDPHDRRKAQYCITDTGKTLIDGRLTAIENSFTNFLTTQKDMDEAKEKLESVLDILSFL